MREPRKRVDVEQRRAELIAALQKIAGEHGPDVSVTRFCRESGFSNTHIYRYFENWADLRAQAGLPPAVDRRRLFAQHTEAGLLDSLLAAAEEFGNDVSLSEFQHHTGISAKSIYRLFGSWHAFKDAAGLHERRNPGLPPQHDEERLLASLRELVQKRGSRITLHDFCRATGISSATLDRHGGWRHFRRRLGLTTKGRRPTSDPHDPLVADLFDLTAALLDPSLPYG
jgi:AcrR family transcriptional regulator